MSKFLKDKFPETQFTDDEVEEEKQIGKHAAVPNTDRTMLIFPLDDPQKSRELFDRELANKFTITMLVFGDGNGEDQIAFKADVCAQALPSARRVVWIRDPEFLTAQEKKDYGLERKNVVVCALSLDDEPVVFLTREKANSFTESGAGFRKSATGLMRSAEYDAIHRG